MLETHFQLPSHRLLNVPNGVKRAGYEWRGPHRLQSPVINGHIGEGGAGCDVEQEAAYHRIHHLLGKLVLPKSE